MLKIIFSFCLLTLASACSGGNVSEPQLPLVKQLEPISDVQNVSDVAEISNLSEIEEAKSKSIEEVGLKKIFKAN